MRTPDRALIVLLSALIVFATACGDDEEPSAKPTGPGGATERPSPSSTAPEPTEEPFVGSREAVEATPAAGLPLGGALLRDVRIAGHVTFERVVLEFEGGLPGYSVQYVKPPIIADASGEEVEIAGSAFIQIRMEPAAAHDPNTGEETYAGPLELKPDFPSILEAQRTGDFEGVLTWVLGLSEEMDFRVLTLQDPPRLVIDVAHF